MTSQLEETPTLALLDGRYQLHEQIGVGGMAHVYRADDLVLGRTVAIKMMRTDADVLATSSRARSEAGALAMLNHPSLVTLLDARIEPDRPRYLVMEFIEGETLAGRLRNGPLTEREIALVGSELAAGLNAVHEAGLLHRDVKPSNVLLGAASAPGVGFRVKLADFGLAQLIGAEPVTTPGVVLGTAAYLSPEQVRGQGSSPASDVYALGLVLIEAFTGVRPFGHTSGIGAVLARLLEPPTIPDEISPHWRPLLQQMTALDPAARPTALEVAQRIADIPEHPTGPLVAAPSTPQILADHPTTRMPAGRHVAAARRRRHTVLETRGKWAQRAAVASSATVAALMIVGAAILGDAASPGEPEVVAGPAPAYTNPFALVPDAAEATAQEADIVVGAVDPAIVPVETVETANWSDGVDVVTQPGGHSSDGPTRADDKPHAEKPHADKPHADKHAADKAARDAEKQAAAEEREAAKQAVAEQREADKAARDAAREADKAAKQKDHH
ncbi:serine/threonine-protein kinase [Microbacterium sp.]|uniref:serine/threonine-protein kinase n=1 Tax=Microbacterium sp. TaxID=51671 RepID=UPI002D77ECDD|nr:serine/threonine-protein kinase [Microbacterium sp.]HET6301156.1 serine/threonine-protein kinase [Microbacterium sp.]